MSRCPPPPPRAQEPPPGSAVEFSHHFFYHGIGFLMVLVDAGQLVRTTFHVCCYGSPHQGGPYQSVTGAHTPLTTVGKERPCICRHSAPEFFFPAVRAAHGHAQEPTPSSAVEFWGESVRKNRHLVLRSNIACSWARVGVRFPLWGGGGGCEFSGFHGQCANVPSVP